MPGYCARCFTYSFSFYVHDHTWSELFSPFYRWEKVRPREVICFIQVLRASKSQRLIWPVFSPLPQICLFSGKLNLLAPKFLGYFLENWAVKNKQGARFEHSYKLNVNVACFIQSRWFLEKTDFEVISLKQILLVYHCGIQDAFPKKEFPSLLHHHCPCWQWYPRTPLSLASCFPLLSETPPRGLQEVFLLLESLWPHPGSSWKLCVR